MNSQQTHTLDIPVLRDDSSREQSYWRQLKLLHVSEERQSLY
jgi:hypothetical protein